MIRIGVARADITAKKSVWLTGYGNRDHPSEGVYQALMAGALYMEGERDAALVLTADHIGYGPAYAALAKAHIAEATGLLPRQIALTATHTHCAPFFSPWVMPGHIEQEYAAFLLDKLVQIAVAARHRAAPGTLSFARGRSAFGVNRRLPDGRGGVLFAPNPDGPVDRHLDTLWLADGRGAPLASLTFFACHPTSVGGYLMGGDYPGYLCRALEEETGAPAFFATGCAGDVRPWFKGEGSGFARPSFAELEAASRQMAGEVLAAHSGRAEVDASPLRVDTGFHLLPYVDLPCLESLEDVQQNHPDPLRRRWAAAMLPMARAGALPRACPQEVQMLRFNSELGALFLGGEVLTEIGLHLKEALAPATTIVAAYSNGLIAYVPSRNTYDLGGYEVDGSHYYFLRPAPFARNAEDLIVARARALAAHLREENAP